MSDYKLSSNTRAVFDGILQRLEGATFDRIGDDITRLPTEMLATAVRTPRVREFFERTDPVFEGRSVSMDERWCSRCSRWKYKSQFSPDRSRMSGVARYCRACQKDYMRERRTAARRQWNDGKRIATAVGKGKRKKSV